jgi:hypothetical protein
MKTCIIFLLLTLHFKVVVVSAYVMVFVVVTVNHVLTDYLSGCCERLHCQWLASGAQ